MQQTRSSRAVLTCTPAPGPLRGKLVHATDTHFVYLSVTAKVTDSDVEGLKATGLVGVNTAVSRCDPTANCDVAPDAVPLPKTITELPRLVLPSLKLHGAGRRCR